MQIRALKGDFAAEVTGIDLTGQVTTDDIRAIKAAFFEHGVAVVRDQHLEPADLCKFSEYFGDLDIHHLAEGTIPDFPQVRVLSNIKKDGKFIGQFRGGHYWHTDLTYTKKNGLVTLLYGLECPPKGGDTLFADMRAAFDALPEDMKKLLDGKIAVHDRNHRYSQLYPERPPLTAEQIAKVPPVDQPAVIVHPVTGRKSVYLNKSLIRTIGDLDEAQTEKLLEKLEAFCTEDRFVYAHKWRVGDLVLWDNLATMHCATPYEYDRYRRLMHRTQVCGAPQSLSV